MKRLAVFVEGQTEQIFVEKLIEEIMGKQNIYVVKEVPKTNRKGERIYTEIDAKGSYTNQEYFILIRDCQNDERVQSDIIDQCQQLHNAKYDRIIGIRDVFPIAKNDLPRLRRAVKHGVPQRLMPINIILAIMEVEAWFLGEVSHFSKIAPHITRQAIHAKIRFDPWIDNVEDRMNPASDLDEIYQIAGLRYDKKRATVSNIVQILDYATMYLGMSSVTSLKAFINELNSFFP